MQNKLGNIVDSNDKALYDVIFNKVSSYDKADLSLPTLVIGMDSAKSVMPTFSILNRDMGDIKWTFTKKERRFENSEDLKEFKSYCINKFCSKFKYEYIAFTCYPYSKVKNLINYLYGNDRKVCFLTKDSRFMFIFSEKYRIVWGLSLSLCDYIGVDRKKVISKIKSNKDNCFINGVSFADDEMRGIIGDNTHLIPLLLHYFGKK